MKILLITALMATTISVPAQENYMFVGTYTHGKARGIYVYDFNSNDGSAKLVDSIATKNPSYLAVSPGKKFIYAVSETGGDEGGRVNAFSFNRGNGKLEQVSRQSSEGDSPCYVTIDKTGKWVIVGNYSSGTAAVFPIKADGTIGPAVSTVSHSGSGPNKKRQEGPHVHATVLSPDNKFLFVTDLGIDQLVVYDFDEITGSLNLKTTIRLEPGSGPRHFEFHSSGKWAYLIEELSGMVTTLENDNGSLIRKQSVSALPAGYDKSFTSADVHVSPDGKFLYASNRDSSNTIAIFRINPSNGEPEIIGHQSTLGKTPRNFCIDPSGNFLLIANQNSDQIVIFKIDKETGFLTDTGKRIEVGKPVCIKF